MMSSALEKKCKSKKARVLLAILESPTLQYENRETLQDLLYHFKGDVLARLLTTANTKALLTEWGSDPVNDNSEFVGLWHLSKLPAPVVAFHAEGILTHVDAVLDGTYGWHEKYTYLWECVVTFLAPTYPRVVAAFVSETMLPRLQAASVDYAERCLAAAARGDMRPSMFQDELLDSSARLGEIALRNAAVLAPHATELREIVRAHWEDLTREGYYEDRIQALRNAVDAPNTPNGGGGGGGSGGSAEAAGKMLRKPLDARMTAVCCACWRCLPRSGGDDGAGVAFAICKHTVAEPIDVSSPHAPHDALVTRFVRSTPARPRRVCVRVRVRVVCCVLPGRRWPVLSSGSSGIGRLRGQEEGTQTGRQEGERGAEEEAEEE
jgi:hypothetical protein